MAVAIDSVGYFEFHRRLCQRLHLDFGTCNRNGCIKEDRRRANRKEYDARPEVRRRQAMQRVEKIKREWDLAMKDMAKGKTYRSGMANPGREDEEEERPKRKKGRPKKKTTTPKRDKRQESKQK